MKRRSVAAAMMLVLAVAVIAGCGDDNQDAGASADTSKGVLTIGAASDLRPAFTELGDLYTKKTGTPVAFSFGSSGQLAQQIVKWRAV